MRGGTWQQIGNLVETSGVFQAGMSKHEVAQDIVSQAKMQAAEESKSLTAQDIAHQKGCQMEMASYKTMHTYADVWKQAADFAKENFGVKDIEKMSPEIVNKFLNSKIDEGVSLKTAENYICAMQKMELALNKYSEKFEKGNTYGFGLKLGCDVRERAKAELTSEYKNRAYENPSEIVKGLDGRSEIIGKIQLEGGARITEAFTIRSENLVGNCQIRLTNTKGGLERTITVSPETYRRIEGFLQQNDGHLLYSSEKLKSAGDDYRSDLRHAAAGSQQEYQGSHGLRWSFAQDKFAEYIKAGYTPEQASSMVSSDLGHIRSDITYHYLGRGQ